MYLRCISRSRKLPQVTTHCNFLLMLSDFFFDSYSAFQTLSILYISLTRPASCLFLSLPSHTHLSDLVSTSFNTTSSKMQIPKATLVTVISGLASLMEVEASTYSRVASRRWHWPCSCKHSAMQPAGLVFPYRADCNNSASRPR